MSKIKTQIMVVISLIAIGLAVIFVQSKFYSVQSNISVIRIGVLPDQNIDQLNKRYSPLINYLSQKMGLKIQLVVPRSYNNLIKKFGNNEIEVAYFGGLTFLKARQLYGAAPLVMRDVDTKFTSYFVVKGDSSLKNCTGVKCVSLRGKKFSFGSKLSTSGHLMPRYFLNNTAGIEPEAYFGRVTYSGAHDKTVYQVRDGNADIGAVNSEVFNSMLRSGKIKKDDLSIIWETPPYPDYVWAINKNLHDALGTKLQNAFLGLEFDKEEHAKVLLPMGTKGFLPVGNTEFEPLLNIAISLGLLSGETP